jgi:hypothetical protein
VLRSHTDAIRRDDAFDNHAPNEAPRRARFETQLVALRGRKRKLDKERRSIVGKLPIVIAAHFDRA